MWHLGRYPGGQEENTNLRPSPGKPTANLLHEYQLCENHLEDLQNARDRTMARASELLRELNIRGEAVDGVHARVESITQRYRTLDRELHDITANGVRNVGPRQVPGGVRPMPASPSSLGGHRVHPSRFEDLLQLYHSGSRASMIGSRPLQPQHSQGMGPSLGASGLQNNSNASAPTFEVGTRLIRRPKRTRCCGKIIEEPQHIVHRRYVNMGGRLYCVLCNKRFLEHGDLFYHFSGCAKDRGNKTGACWYDHPSVKEHEIPDSLMEDVSDEE